MDMADIHTGIKELFQSATTIQEIETHMSILQSILNLEYSKAKLDLFEKISNDAYKITEEAEKVLEEEKK